MLKKPLFNISCYISTNLSDNHGRGLVLIIINNLQKKKTLMLMEAR